MKQFEKEQIVKECTKAASGKLPEAVDTIESIGILISREDLRLADQYLLEAAIAVAEDRGSWRQEAAINVVKQAGGVDVCSPDWVREVVEHASDGDDPANLDPGTIGDDVRTLYDELVAEREGCLEVLIRDGVDRESAELDFDNWADLPRDTRPFFPEAVK